MGVPDVHLPEGVPAPGALSMCGGDFVEVCRDPHDPQQLSHPDQKPESTYV